MKTFAELGLCEELLQAIEEQGYEHPMPVQEEVIPWLLSQDTPNVDLIALAQTGTGKTAAYGLPVLEKLRSVEARGPKALILSPTRELCLQIADDLEGFSKHMPSLRILAVYGGANIEPQIRALKAGVDIIVATPGRLLDLMKRGVAQLSNISHVVLDEADEMLSMGFQEDLDAILEGVPQERSTLLFSATMSKEIERIAKNYLHSPHTIQVGSRNEGAESVNHIYYMVHAKDKYLALKRIVDFYPRIYAIIFCRTRMETQEIADKAWKLIQEIEELGGMAKAIETGIPKMRIEEAAARTQARIDSGKQVIVGTNAYKLDEEEPIDILEIDNTAVRKEQLAALERNTANRDEAAVKAALAKITEYARSGEGNLLECAVEAAHLRATLGEISDACEDVAGRYKAVIRTISGVYSAESKDDESFREACRLTDEFAKREGRRPRVMVAKMGQDGHDRGAKVVATGYADCGFDVDMGMLFQTPAEVARQAVENDVHAVGVSSLAAGHKTLVPQLIEELDKLGRGDIMVFAGGVIPAQDYEFLYRAGVIGIFGPGTSVAKAACELMKIFLDK